MIYYLITIISFASLQLEFSKVFHLFSDFIFYFVSSFCKINIWFPSFNMCFFFLLSHYSKCTCLPCQPADDSHFFHLSAATILHLFLPPMSCCGEFMHNSMFLILRNQYSSSQTWAVLTTWLPMSFLYLSFVKKSALRLSYF